MVRGMSIDVFRLAPTPGIELNTLQYQPAAVVKVHNFADLGARFLDLHVGPGASAVALPPAAVPAAGARA